MAATATPTDRKRRKHKPFPHIVRIVVVRPAAGSTPAVHNDRHGQGDGLTEAELKMGEQALQGVDPAGLPITTSGKHVTMFDVLEPTDIVVMGSEPASVRVLNKHGKPVAPRTADRRNSAAVPSEPTARHLHSHDDRNRDTVLRVWTKSDTIEYQCDEKFEIVRLEKAGWKIYGTPNNPFGRRLPYRAKQCVRGGKLLWVWKSGVLQAKANNQQYKATFKIRGKLIDPDVVCGDPPPAP